MLRIGGVPLYSGFMYAAVGSYMVRVYRLFDLRFSRYPRRWLTAGSWPPRSTRTSSPHHWIVDLRWVLVVAVVVLWGTHDDDLPCIFRGTFRMPSCSRSSGVAVFIWLAENIATYAGAWLYPSQVGGWHPVDASKLSSWFLLMIVSVVLVTWVYPPREPDPVALSAADKQIAVP